MLPTSTIPNTAIIDLQIAGVGTGRVGRYTGKEENKNKGFFIQIIPKVGEL